jgi:predicted alpha-1,2-mannosidase
MPRSPTRFGATWTALAAFIAVALLAPSQAGAHAGSSAVVTSPARYVNPLIGTSAKGNVFPGAVLPHGMIGWSPVASAGDPTAQHSSAPGASGTYTYESNRVRGFSLTHFNGAGCPADSDIPIMPVTKEVTTSPSLDENDSVYGATYTHGGELAQAGYYKLKLSNGVTTEITVTGRAGYGRFTFPAGAPANLLFRASNSDNGSTDASVHIDPATNTASGMVESGAFCLLGGPLARRASYYKLYFFARFDQPIKTSGTWLNGTVTPGSTTAEGGEGLDNRVGLGSGGWVGFDTSVRRSVGVRIGISYVSAANAAQNLGAEIPPNASFASVKAKAFRAWQRELGRVRISGGTHDQRTVFYTALYHAAVQPQLYSDVNGQYTGADGRTHTVTPGQHAQYSTFSGWDVYRGQIQLMALLNPNVAGDFAQSLLNYANQRGGEWDRWLDRAGKTSVMVGDPSPSTIAGIYAFGARNFAVTAALDSLTKAATSVSAADVTDCSFVLGCPGQRPGLDQYLRLHYLSPVDCHCGSAASETLEQSQADFAIARLSRALGRHSMYKRFLARGKYWRNLWNPKARGLGIYAGVSGWIQNRNPDGTWPTGFDPSAFGPSFLGSPGSFAEGNSARYTWMVYDDVAGLIRLMGGNRKAAARLDTFFHNGAAWAIAGGGPGRFDATNEPDIQTPWLYDYMGVPHKTQATVRQIVNKLWRNTPSGITGNDDLGAMSAGYVWAALGMYPQVPSRAELVLASPLFPHIEITRGNGKTITIDAPGASAKSMYVQGLRVNGVSSDKPWLPAPFVTGGGTLDYSLGKVPSNWGSRPADSPPSLG